MCESTWQFDSVSFRHINKKNHIINNKNGDITPIITYTNIKMNKFNICTKNNDKSGIYRLVNKINGISYISSSL